MSRPPATSQQNRAEEIKISEKDQDQKLERREQQLIRESEEAAQKNENDFQKQAWEPET